MKKVGMFKDQRGFTLIELAIVLVIIGIILGAALKGPDLIRSARTKKFVNDIKKWEIAAWTHYDRKGSFPGDYDKDGIIGPDGAPMNDLASLNLAQPPASPLTYGSFQFYVFLGHDAAGDDNDGTQQNTLVICAEADCGKAFTADEISFVEAFDTAIDGFADGTRGLVRGSSVSPTTAVSSLGSFTPAGFLGVAYASPPVPIRQFKYEENNLAYFKDDLTQGYPLTADGTMALVYFFDRPPNAPVQDSTDY